MDVIVRPENMKGTGFPAGTKRMIRLKMNKKTEAANHVLYTIFIYSRKRLWSPVISAIAIHVRCLISRAARNAPARTPVIPAYPPNRPGIASPQVRIVMAAKILIFNMVKMFLNIGGHEKTSDVPGGITSPCLLKLMADRPLITFLRPKTVRIVMIIREKESRMKLRSELIISAGLGSPSMRLMPAI